MAIDCYSFFAYRGPIAATHSTRDGRAAFSLHTFLVGFLSIVAITLLLGSEIRSTVIFSKDERNIVVEGRCFLRMVDRDRETPVFCRSAKLVLDSELLLCAEVEGISRRIDPPVPFPFKTERLSVLSDGNVLAWTDNYCIYVGTIDLVVFNGDAPEDERLFVPDMNWYTYPMVTQPGYDGAGFLRSAYQRVDSIPMNSKTLTAMSVACIPLLWCFVPRDPK
ncbi:MAG: hypothetical protein U0905_00475 [Pirellulales bacterium]